MREQINPKNDTRFFGHDHNKEKNELAKVIPLPVKNQENLRKTGLYLGATAVSFSTGVYFAAESLQPNEQTSATVASLATGLGLTSVYVFAPQIERLIVNPFSRLINKIKR
jgi:hypothetical protein